MGFLEAYLILTVVGFIAPLLGKKYRQSKKAFPACWSAGWTLGLLATDIAIYTGLFNWFLVVLGNFIPWMPVVDGTTYMWNSLIMFGMPLHVTPHAGMNVMSILMFMNYPAWYAFIKRISNMVFGTRTYQGGLRWIFTMVEKPKNLEGV